MKNFSDKNLNYGRSQIFKMAPQDNTNNVKILDVGCGLGFDLLSLSKKYKNTELYGIDFFEKKLGKSSKKVVNANIKFCDIENECFPFKDESFDIVLINQVLEHCKNIHHIISEIIRITNIKGSFIIGVPNIAALHNRILLFSGMQPSCIQLDSGHVRGFTSKSLEKFVYKIGSGSVKLNKMRGANFYPFPPLLAEFFAEFMPNFAVSIFLRFDKFKFYDQSYIKNLQKNPFETSYYLST